jgi:hypothetical protein
MATGVHRDEFESHLQEDKAKRTLADGVEEQIEAAIEAVKALLVGVDSEYVNIGIGGHAKQSEDDFNTVTASVTAAPTPDVPEEET